MDNFYLRYLNSFDLKEESNERLILDYKYETLFLNKDNTLILTNKHTKNEREIGTISAEIQRISKSTDEKYTVIVTKEDILLFDSYLDLIDSVDLKEFLEPSQTLCDVQWADEEFCIAFTSKLLFFDSKLKLLGFNGDYEFRSVCFREKYNIFVCATTEKIVFIESNGLEHGDSLDVDTYNVRLIGDDILICAKEQTNENVISTTVEILYSKNFHWYKKQKVTFPGRLHRIENTEIFIEEGGKIRVYCVIRKIDTFNNIFYVIDDCNILYSDMNEAKIPPPLSKLNLNFKERIRSIDVQENLMILLHDKLLRLDGGLSLMDVHELGVSEFPSKIDFCLSFAEYCLMFYEEKIFIYSDEEVREVDLKHFISLIFGQGELKSVSPDFKMKDYVFEKSDQIIDMKNFNGTPFVVLNDGRILLDNILYDLKFDSINSYVDLKVIDGNIMCGVLINRKFTFIRISRNNEKNILFERFKEITKQEMNKKQSKIFEVENEEFYHSFEANQTYIEIISVCDIESFFFDPRSIIFIRNQFMSIILKDDRQSLFVDPGFNVLGCSDLEIYGETRHGTLETFYPRAFSDIFIQRLIEQKMYSRAFELSSNNYNLFLRNNLDLKSLAKCANKTILAFLVEVSKAFKDYRIILGDEEVEQLRNELNDEEYLEDPSEQVKTKEIYIYLENPEIRKLLNLSDKSIGEVKSCPVDSCLDYSSRSAFINELLKHLDLDKNLEIFLFVFVKFKRTDLAVKISRINLVRGIRYLMTLTTIEDLKKSAILSFDRNLIIDIYRIIQQDASDVISFIDLEGNVEFRLCNLIEDRERALYYYIKEVMGSGDLDNPDLKHYVKKYVLNREVLVLSCSLHFTNKRNDLLELFADTSSNHLKAIKAYKYLGQSDKLVNLYIEKTMFREAIEEYKGDMNDIYPRIIDVLDRNGLYYELGVLYEVYIQDKNLCIDNFLKSKHFSDVLRVIQETPSDSLNINKIINECIATMRSQLIVLENLNIKYKKYRDRLKTINERDEDYVNDETSFSYTIVSEKTRGRPGGIYEKEWVLDRLSSIGTKIFKWREEISDLVNVFEYFNRKDCVEIILTEFNILRDILREEFYDFFKDEDYISFKNDGKKVEAPDLSKYI